MNGLSVCKHFRYDAFRDNSLDLTVEVLLSHCLFCFQMITFFLSFGFLHDCKSVSIFPSIVISVCAFCVGSLAASRVTVKNVMCQSWLLHALNCSRNGAKIRKRKRE